MSKVEEKKDWKLRVFKSDLPELKERINFLTGKDWDISIGIDGVEDLEDLAGDGRLVINKVPEEWVPKVIIAWIKKRKRTRQEIKNQMSEEILHLQFVEDLVQRQFDEINTKAEKSKK